jgi:UDP-N-acetyl-D-mannosaminuronate dehydrogenase
MLKIDDMKLAVIGLGYVGLPLAVVNSNKTQMNSSNFAAN